MNGVDILKNIGAQKIHETTHISKQHVQAIIHGSFEDINKIQFIGFISILEKEYEIDLTDLRDKGIAYFNDVTTYDQTPKKSVFVTTETKTTNKKFFLIIIILIFITAVVYKSYPFLLDEKQTDKKVNKLDNKIINNAKKIIISEKTTHKNIYEENISTEPIKISEKNISIIKTDLNTSAKIIKKTKVEVKTIINIEPRIRVWMGYIDLKTHKKHQKVFKGNFLLDTSKDWIIVFGHSNINIEVNGLLKKYSSNKNLRFLFKNGKLEKIDYKKFKELNEGKEW